MEAPFEWNREHDTPVIAPGRPYDVNGVADPIAFSVKRKLWILYEGLDPHDHATINAAFSSDGVTFRKFGGNPVFDEYYHQSFPALYCDGDEVYLMSQRPSNTLSLWKTDVDSFPTRWRHIWDKQMNTRSTDTTLFKHDGSYYFCTSLRQNRSQPRYFLKLLVTDNLEDETTIREVGDIYPTDPHSPVAAERSAFLHRHQGDILLYHQANLELDEADGLVFGGERGTRIHGLRIRDLSPEGFEYERFADNPVLTPTDDWESARVHSFSVVKFDGTLRAYYDGHDGDQWCGIGVVAATERQNRHAMPPSDSTRSNYVAGPDVCDDFADCELHRRQPVIPGAATGIKSTGCRRPVWTVEAGDPSIDDGELRFPADGRSHSVTKFSPSATGTWSFEVEFTGETETTAFEFYPVSASSLRHPLVDHIPVHDDVVSRVADSLPGFGATTNWWCVQVLAGGQIRLEKHRSGRTAAVFETTVERTERFHVRVDRDPRGTWTLHCDNEYLGTVEDRFLPSFSSIRLRAVDVESPVTVHGITAVSDVPSLSR